MIEIEKVIEKVEETKTMPLICLRCRKPIPLTYPTFSEVSYTHYSYCEDCLRKGLDLLRQQDKEGGTDEESLTAIIDLNRLKKDYAELHDMFTETERYKERSGAVMCMDLVLKNMRGCE